MLPRSPTSEHVSFNAYACVLLCAGAVAFLCFAGQLYTHLGQGPCGNSRGYCLLRAWRVWWWLLAARYQKCLLHCFAACFCLFSKSASVQSCRDVSSCSARAAVSSRASCSTGFPILVPCFGLPVVQASHMLLFASGPPVSQASQIKFRGVLA